MPNGSGDDQIRSWSSGELYDARVSPILTRHVGQENSLLPEGGGAAALGQYAHGPIGPPSPLIRADDPSLSLGLPAGRRCSPTS